MCKRACARLVLVLACILRLGAFNGHIGHDIPRIVDPHEQEQHRHRRDNEQDRSRGDWKQNRRYGEGGVGDEWQERTRSCAIKVMTTNIKPVSVAAAAPTRT